VLSYQHKKKVFRQSDGPAIKGGCVTRRQHRLCPGTLAARLSRCKEGMAHFLQSRYRIMWRIRASRYRVVKVLVNYPDAVKLIEGSGAVWVYQELQTCLGSRSKSPPVRPCGRAGKKCDKQLTFIVRVISRVLFIPLFKYYPRSRFVVLF
jgi:hypothetical protein